jgi:hypothetical protein
MSPLQQCTAWTQITTLATTAGAIRAEHEPLPKQAESCTRGVYPLLWRADFTNKERDPAAISQLLPPYTLNAETTTANRKGTTTVVRLSIAFHQHLLVAVAAAR